MTENEFEKHVNEWKTYASNLSNKISFDSFNDVIDRTVNLLNFLSESASRSPTINMETGRTSILGGEFLVATSSTLTSISSCCNHGSFADANMLIRKYRDDLFLYLYILEANNNKVGLTEEKLDQLVGEEMNADRFLEAVTATIGILSSGIRKDKENRAIDAWFNNSAESGKYSRLLDIKNYRAYLEKNALVKDCINTHDLQGILDILARRQNNYTHNNGVVFLTDNIINYRGRQRSEELLEQVGKDITFITSLFLTVLILIRADYIMSSDFIDDSDAGLDPPDGCQYWVASVVQEYMSMFVDILHPALRKYLRENNPYGMLIDS